MAGIEHLVDELERSYRELQERLSDPAVYNDHREAADVGRRLKELETPHRLAKEWLAAQEDRRAARGGARARARRAGSGRLEGRDRRDPAGCRR